MIQRSSGARLPLKAAQTVAILLKARRQQLEGDLAAEFEIVREIDLAHRAASDLPDDPEVTDKSPDRRRFQRSLRGFADHRFHDVRASLAFRRQQRDDFRSYVLVANSSDECRTVTGGKLQHLVKEPLHFGPVIGLHLYVPLLLAGRRLSEWSSRRSQARAK